LAGARSTAPARCGALVDLGFVEVEADLAQGVAHAQGALLAVGQELVESTRHRRPGVVDVVTEDVQFTRL
jgi:hypothetical protein